MNRILLTCKVEPRESTAVEPPLPGKYGGFSQRKNNSNEFRFQRNGIRLRHKINRAQESHPMSRARAIRQRYSHAIVAPASAVISATS